MSTGCGRCRHGRGAHLHYRAGTDCALCGCPGFSWRLLDLLRLPRTRDRGDGQGRLLLVAIDGVRVG